MGEVLCPSVRGLPKEEISPFATLATNEERILPLKTGLH